MDPKLTSLSHFIKSIFLRKRTQLLLSVSVFSFIYSPFLLSFLHSFNFYVSTLPLQLFSHTIDKNFIFLICNGIVVFLAKSISGSGQNDESEPFKYKEDLYPPESLVLDMEEEEEAAAAEEPLMEKEEKYLIEYLNVENEKYGLEEEEGGLNSKGSIQLRLEEAAGQKKDLRICDSEEEEEEEKEEENAEEILSKVAEENYMLSTEEMNKKFDEFIRRMKEDLRNEAQRQLVMV